MRALVLLLLFGLPAWATSSGSSVTERLNQIADDIRARASEANEEIEKARKEAQRLTQEAEKRAKQIRDEADAYEKKIEHEIGEIRKEMPGYVDRAHRHLPTREALGKALNGLVDPFRLCFEAKSSVALQDCLWKTLRDGLRPHLAAVFPAPRAACELKCAEEPAEKP
jgi:hypothetical protein